MPTALRLPPPCPVDLGAPAASCFLPPALASSFASPQQQQDGRIGRRDRDSRFQERECGLLSCSTTVLALRADSLSARRTSSRRSSNSLRPQILEVSSLLLSCSPSTNLQLTYALQPVSPAALHLSAEYLRLFATEALHRSAEVAAKEREERGAAAASGPSLLEVSLLAASR